MRFTPSNLLTPSFPQKRESSELKNPRVAGQHCGFVRYAEHIFCWIPAFAGMTSFRFNGLFRFLLLFFFTASFAHAGFLDNLSNMGETKQPKFLPPDEAFQLKIVARDAHTLQASFTITEGYYLYRDKIKLSGKGGAIKITPNLPQGDMKDDPNFGLTQVYHHSFLADAALEGSSDGASSVTVDAVYQGCSEQGLCYPPINKTLLVDLTPASFSTASVPPAASAQAVQSSAAPSENSKIAQLFKSGNFWLIISFFFGAGLLLSLTPCVFPMIPILSGIIVGRGHKLTKMHAFMLSLAYVLGMAITYAIAGVAAGLSGDLISNALQTPWVLGSFAAVFVVLSLSMFGFYELQMPTALQSKLTDTSNKLHGGHLGGVFVMGALSAVIMGPCVAAPLAGALLYIGQTHDAVLGGVALFVLALGMGAPLLLIGTSAGVLLPKAGAWMEAVKRFFGVMLLALAIWIVQPLLPMGVQMLLWAALLLFSAIYLGALSALPVNAKGKHKLQKGLALFVLLIGVAYLIGALSGARDLMRPLGGIARSEATEFPKLNFVRIKDVADLNQRIAQAKGQPVMLDFYADWCVSCKEMERYTFSDAAVQAALKGYLFLQADVTANSEADKALLKRFDLFGPPGIIFFNAQGAEIANTRVIGHQDAAEFLKSIRNAASI
jgi:thiol:disulfide interchange protein DsbD